MHKIEINSQFRATLRSLIGIIEKSRQPAVPEWLHCWTSVES